MKPTVFFLTLLFTPLLFAAANIGEKAPDFKVKDAQGKTHKLGDYKGQMVVLEWYNKDCPYVRKHYDSQNMQNTQKQLKSKGVTWLTVISSAPGKQGHQSPKATLANAKKEGTLANSILRDESGDMGKAYGAKTTPHMYLINKKGVLVYKGAIDSNDSANPKTIASATNYIKAAVNSTVKGEKVQKASTKAYGCSVKY